MHVLVCVCMGCGGLWRYKQMRDGALARFGGRGRGMLRSPAVGCRLVCDRMNSGPRQKEKGLRLGLALRVLLGLVWVPTQGRFSSGPCLGFLFDLLSPYASQFFSKPKAEPQAD